MLFVCAAALFIVIGVVALVVAFRAPPEEHEFARDLAYRGLGSLVVGLAIGAGYWLFRFK